MTSRNVLWGEFQGTRKFETPEHLPDDARDLLLRMMIVQADTEFASIQQHRPFLDRGPTAADRLGQARVMADEMRHGWQICEVLAGFGEDGRRAAQEVLDRREGQHKLEAFNIPYETWGDVVAYACLIDRVGIYQLNMFEECSYGPLARAIPLMIVEEKFHIHFGAQGLKRLAQIDKPMAQEAVRKWYPRALDMFGHSRSASSQKAVDYGFKRWTNEEARAKYIDEVTELLHGMDLEVPDPDYDRHVR